MFLYGIAMSILAGLTFVTGHGGGKHYNIDGVVYDGNQIDPSTINTEGSIQRGWTWGNNVVTLNNPDMACGHDGAPHAVSWHAPIIAGNIVSVNYSAETIFEETGRPWTFGHPYGPMMAYLAACPDEGCESVDINASIWFKIWHAGLISGNHTGYWAMRDVYEGANLDIPIPASLKPGKYLFRHDMLNLQTGPPQWFPNCIQLDVSGEGSSLPADEELVSFPGAYDKDDGISFSMSNGHQWFYWDHGAETEYTIPGPPVWEG